MHQHLHAAQHTNGADQIPAATTGSPGLMSAAQAQELQDAAASTWILPVLDSLNTPPVTPGAGDRYRIDADPIPAVGVWIGLEDQIAEWDGAAWLYTIPVAGNVVVDIAADDLLRYSGSAWLDAGYDAAEIKTLYESNADTNAFTDAEQTNLGNQSNTNTGDEPDATTSAKGIVELATDGENAANVAVQGNDSRLADARTPTAHNLGGAEHNADTLANLNLKVSDATLIPDTDSRLTDARTPTAHNLGGAEHNADTLANLNLKVSDATLIPDTDSRLTDARTPTAHNLGGAEHNADTLANLNLKVSDATLIPDTDSRLTDARTPLAHALVGALHTVPAPTTVTPDATPGTTDIDWANGPIQIVDLANATGTEILTFSNLQTGHKYELFIKQHLTTPQNVTLPSTVKLPGGTAPTTISVSVGAAAIDRVVMTYDGTNLYADPLMQNYG